MNLRARFAATMLTMLFLTTGVSPGNATCWTCLYDSGLGQYYCQSVAGSFYNNCVPVWNEYCNLGTPSYCPEDGCGCQRYPDPPRSKNLASGSRNSLGVLLFRADDPETHRVLLAALSDTPVTFEIGDAVLTPAHAIAAIAAKRPGLRPGALMLAGYVAVTKRGPASTRLLRQGGQGILVDSRFRSRGQHVRVSQLDGGTLVEMSHELALAPNQAAMCRVRLGTEGFACVVWARRADDAPAPMADFHRDFVEAANTFPAREIAAFNVDSPDLRPFAFSRRVGEPSPWGSVASYYH